MTIKRCETCFGIKGSKLKNSDAVCTCESELKQPCESAVLEGEYDEIIKASIKDIIYIVMKSTGGQAHPKQILERIVKLTKEI